MDDRDGIPQQPAGSAEDAHDGAGRRRGRGGERAGDTYGASIGGTMTGPLVVGHHNVVIDGDGSTVNLVTPRERPTPRRREQALLLPRRSPELIGREVELSALEAAVRAGGLVQLWGPPGVGKSSLLRHAARCLEPGRDGVLFLSAAHREVEDLAQEVFEACYEAPGYAPTRTELRRLMAQVEVTVYVDDADQDPERLRALADAAPAATFVFAGHERTLPGESAQLALQGLHPAAGLELLARELRGPLPPSERVAAEELCALSLGRPLLLLRAAGLARLDASGTGLTLPRPASVQGLLPLLLPRLDATALRVLDLLATLPDAEVAPGHIGALCGADDPDALCAELTALGLTLAAERGYRCAPDAVPEVRRRSPEPFPVERLCDHFTEWAASPAATPAQVADHGRALELVAELAERQGRPELAVRLARAVSPLLARSLRFGVWGRLLDRGQDAARRAGDATATAYFTHERAVRCLLIGQRVAAAVLLAEAVVLWRELGDDRGAEAALNAQQYAPPEPAAPTDPGPGADPPAPDPGTDATNPAQDPHPDRGVDPGPQDVGPAGSPDTAAAPPTAPDAPAASAPSEAPAQPEATGTASTPDAGGPTRADGPDPVAEAASTSPAPPVPDGSAHLLDPTGHTVSHAAAAPTAPAVGAVGAGGAATGGASAFAGLGGMVKVLAALVTAALVVGTGIQQEWWTDRAASSTDTNAGTWQDRAGSSDAPRDAERERASASPSPLTDELAGAWRDGSGNTFQVAKTGSGSYALLVGAGCGDTETVRLSGGDGSYSGTVPVSDRTSCTVVGRADMTVSVATDGDTAQVVTTARLGADRECYNCGTQTWTRLA
ncbi:ATP-binding protein [Streptomyces sp. LE64]|uniref:ATP-binding protein n=1 Tax=Streptomyces sp. LE64 TaxID=3448653 RepID=UPI00404264C7